MDKTLAKTEGQLALEKAERMDNGRVISVPRATLREVLSLFRGGVPYPTIADKYGITEANAVYYVKRAREIFEGKKKKAPRGLRPSELAKLDARGETNVKSSTKQRGGGKAIWVNYDDARYIDALAHVMGVKNADVIKVIVTKFKKQLEVKGL